MPHRIFNIGNSKAIQLEEFIACLENEIGMKAIKEYKDMQPGDVKETQADNTILTEWLGELKETPLEIGIKEFVNWYRKFYI